MSEIDQQQLISLILGTSTPEWSISKQEWQPFDQGNETAGMNILQDRFALLENPLLQILNGSFDYSLLDDVPGTVEAPSTPMLDSYAGNAKYAALISELQNGASPEEAARGAWAKLLAERDGKELSRDDIWKTSGTEEPELGNFIKIAESLQSEVGEVRSFQQTGGNGMVQSDMSKQLEALGISGEQTPDSYFSDSIEDELEAEARGLVSSKATIDGYLEERSKFGGGRTNPYMAGLGEYKESETEIQDSLGPAKPTFPDTPEGAQQKLQWQSQQDFNRDKEHVGNVWDAAVGKVTGPINDLKRVFNGTLGKPSETESSYDGTPSSYSYPTVQVPGMDYGNDGPWKNEQERINRNSPGWNYLSDDRSRSDELHENIAGPKPGKYSGGGDPRDPRSQTAQAIKWDEDREKYQNRSLSDAKKYVDAKQGYVHGNSSAIERGLIARERSSGRSIQQDAVLKSLLSLGLGR